MTETRHPYDPSDAHDLNCERVRTAITTTAIQLQGMKSWQSLPPEMQISCWMAGGLTAVIGVILASTDPKCHDDVMVEIIRVLPEVRLMAEGINSNGEASLATMGDTKGEAN